MNTTVADEQINQHIVAKQMNETKCRKILEFTPEDTGPELFAPDLLLRILTLIPHISGLLWPV